MKAVRCMMLTLEKLLDDFYQISGIGIVIVDKQFHTVLMECRRGGELFCEAIHKSQKCLKACLQSDKEAFRKVEQIREPYVYTCPFGLKEIMVPIFDDHSAAGYFFLVMGLEKKENDFLPIERVMKFSNEFHSEQLRKLVKILPHNSDDTVEAYLHLLTIMADYIGKYHLLKENNQSLGELIKSYIDKNIDRKITLTELSKTLHRSIVTLTECFRKEFNISIMQYVFQQRMKAAARLLKETDSAVGEVAYSCGFQDAEYFSRCFKGEFGEPPSIWRKKNGKV